MTSNGDEASAGVKNSGITWEFVRQRPDRVVGSQEVSKLTDLPEGQISCEEGQRCFYFSCGKCSSFLALDTLNFGYKDTMQYVPRITCIPAPEKFEEDNQYHGEITEIYWNFLAQLRPGLKGIGINGWSNINARKVFKYVRETFSGEKKFEKSKDFEIDWILFNGHTITVIEVKEKSRAEPGKNGGKEKNFESKVDQIKRDRIIMQHLLKVTGCQHVRVNYVIACPNVSISEVQGRILENHKQLLQEIVGSGDTMSFISKECMSREHVYLYIKDCWWLRRTNFGEVLEPPYVGKTNETDNTHSEWQNNYRWLASSVIISILMIGNDVDAESEQLVPDDLRTIVENGQNLMVQPPASVLESIVETEARIERNRGSENLGCGAEGKDKLAASTSVKTVGEPFQIFNPSHQRTESVLESNSNTEGTFQRNITCSFRVLWYCLYILTFYSLLLGSDVIVSYIGHFGIEYHVIEADISTSILVLLAKNDRLPLSSFIGSCFLLHWLWCYIFSFGTGFYAASFTFALRILALANVSRRISSPWVLWRCIALYLRFFGKDYRFIQFFATSIFVTLVFKSHRVFWYWSFWNCILCQFDYFGIAPYATFGVFALSILAMDTGL